MYRSGCRCLPCRAANADYERHRLLAHQRGRPLLGTLVPAADAARKVRQLQIEGITKAAIARALGLKHPILQLHTGPDAKATRRLVLKIQRFWRLKMAEGPNSQSA